MNRIRFMLQSGGFGGKCVLAVVLTILLARAFLSNAVMLDPDAPEGSFGIVLCSGAGPWMLPAAMPGMTMAAGPSLPSMSSMSSMPLMSSMHAMHSILPAKHAGDVQPAAPNHDNAGDSDNDGLCPFSAAFLTAISSALVLPLLFGLITIPRVWRTPLLRQPLVQRQYRRPPAHAPPPALI